MVVGFAGDFVDLLPYPYPTQDAEGGRGRGGEGVLHFTEPTINVLRQSAPLNHQAVRHPSNFLPAALIPPLTHMTHLK